MYESSQGIFYSFSVCPVVFNRQCHPPYPLHFFVCFHLIIPGSSTLAFSFRMLKFMWLLQSDLLCDAYESWLPDLSVSQMYWRWMPSSELVDPLAYCFQAVSRTGCHLTVPPISTFINKYHYFLFSIFMCSGMGSLDMEFPYTTRKGHLRTILAGIH